MALDIIFFVSLFGAIYSYLLYPAILLVLPNRALQQSGETTPDLPFVSIIITAHNEEARIGAKLDNTVAISYPAHRREILVASDASSDATDDIVRRYTNTTQEIILVRSEERRGKEHAQSLAITQAKGEILVFTDVSTMIPPGAIEAMVENFRHRDVGAVSSEDRFLTADNRVAGEGAYVRYEMWLRSLESRKGGVVGLSGSFFAARRDVCKEWDIRIPSDFNIGLSCARLGYVAVSDPRVLGYYPNISDERREYVRKVRTVTRGIAALVRHAEVLNPFAFGAFAFKVWSHKVMRWLVPWFLLGVLISSYLLAGQHWFYRIAFFTQAGLYLLALANPWISTGKHALLRIPYFFVQANVAIVHATLAFLLGKRVTVWEPSKR